MNHIFCSGVYATLASAALFATATTLNGQITIVDAVHGASGNTLKTGSSLADGTWVSNANNSTANNTTWVTRSTLSFSNTPLITQTVGVPALTYNMIGVKIAQKVVAGGARSMYPLTGISPRRMPPRTVSGLTESAMNSSRRQTPMPTGYPMSRSP